MGALSTAPTVWDSFVRKVVLRFCVVVCVCENPTSFFGNYRVCFVSCFVTCQVQCFVSVDSRFVSVSTSAQGICHELIIDQGCDASARMSDPKAARATRFVGAASRMTECGIEVNLLPCHQSRVLLVGKGVGGFAFVAARNLCASKKQRIDV